MITAKEMSRFAGIKLEAISHQRDGEPVEENEKGQENYSINLVKIGRLKLMFFYILNMGKSLDRMKYYIYKHQYIIPL